MEQEIIYTDKHGLLPGFGQLSRYGRAEWKPCKLRIYTLCHDAVWYLHYVQKRSLDEISNYYPCSYRVRLEITVPYNADKFEKTLESGGNLLDVTGYLINTDEVIELIDGKRPVFFMSGRAEFR